MTRRVSITITKDRVADVLDGLRSLIGKQVLVGIPEDHAERTDGGPSNAMIGYVQEFGSPAQNIPARPFLIPGVQKAEQQVLPHLTNAINAALDGNDSKVTAELHACGEIAVASVRKRISSNIPPPLAPATIRGRRYSRGTLSRRAAEVEYSKLVAGGMPPALAQAAAGIKSLINSGELLRSVTYVIRDDDKHPHTHRSNDPSRDKVERNLSDGHVSGFASVRSGESLAGAAQDAAEGVAGEAAGAAEGIASEVAGAIGAIIP